MHMESFDFSKYFAISNRHITKSYLDSHSFTAYAETLAHISSFHPKALILREKDLSDEQYKDLFMQVKHQLHDSHMPLYLHDHYELLTALPADGIHLSFPAFLFLAENRADVLTYCHTNHLPIGTSIHSVEDALRAESLGADYCFAGTIWESQCKPGKAASGLSFLSEVCTAVKIPVYAIGGVTIEKNPNILSTGAAGGCMMSGFLNVL